MNTSEVLYGAADHIRCFGHHKGSAVGGDGGVHAAPMCTVGAIAYVTHMGGGTGAESWNAQESVGSYLGRDIVGWNDAPERTAEEVIEVLRAAAVIEAAKETDVRVVSA